MTQAKVLCLMYVHDTQGHSTRMHIVVTVAMYTVAMGITVAMYTYIHTCIATYTYRMAQNFDGENIDEFDEFSTICQYFPYQNFTFSHLPIMNLWRSSPK